MRVPTFEGVAATAAGKDEKHPVFQAALQVAKFATAYHRAELVDAHHLPRGPALIVGNHGLFGWETLVFFYLTYRETGRVPIGLADRYVFGAPPVREVLHCVGGVPGTRENALEALGDGRLVVCYPGGSREVFKAPERRYRLQWESARGFAEIACEMGVPIIPFAGLGVDDTYVNLGHAPLTRTLLGRYAVPFALGLGPLPLPVQLRFRFAPAVQPQAAGGNPERLKRLVQRSVEGLLEEHGELAPAPATAVP